MIEITSYQCEHCMDVYECKSRCGAHELNCMLSPDRHGCVTCMYSANGCTYCKYMSPGIVSIALKPSRVTVDCPAWESNVRKSVSTV